MFSDSDLRACRFEGAFIDRTRFIGNNQLENAKFGGVARVQSLFDGKRLLDDQAQISDWILARTGVVESASKPCPTALQVQRLFQKFITPLGEPRRDDLRFDALCAGKHWDGAARIQECIKEMVGQGYLTGPDSRERFRRVGGDKYAEMVRFVRDSAISDGLGQAIARLCRLRGCLHQFR